MPGHQLHASHQRARKQFGKVAGLLVALDRREHQFNRPLGRHALSFQRIRKAKSTDNQIGFIGAAAVELTIHVLAFAQSCLCGQHREFLCEMLAM